LKTHAKSISGSLFNAILDRIEQFPAREYTAALADILPCCTAATFEGVIIPLLHRFIGRGEAYEAAVGELLTAHQFAVIPPSPDLFSKFLASPTIINDYLPGLIQLAVEAGGVTEDWCCRLYPGLIMHAGRSNAAVRVGAVEALAYLSDVIHPSQLVSYLGTALEWWEGNPEVGLTLAARADELLNSRTVSLAPRFAGLMRQLADSGPAILARIPRILGSNPAVFLNADDDAADLIDIFMASPDLGVRVAFLDSYVLLFARAPGHATQEALLRGFNELFENPPPVIASRLAGAQPYAFFGPAKLLQLMPTLISFAPQLRCWRDVGQLAQTFLSFPSEVLRPNWREVARVLLPLFVQHAHALASQCPIFCSRFTNVLEPDTRRSFVQEVLTQLGAGGWAARRLLAPVVASAATLLAPSDAGILHAALRVALADSVPAVVVAAMAPLGRLRELWSLKGQDDLEQDIVAIFLEAKKIQNQIVEEAWKAAWAASEARGAGSGLPRLPSGIPREERGRKPSIPSPLKAVASLQTAVKRPGALLGLAPGVQPRKRTFQVSDLHKESIAASSYSGRGAGGGRLSEPALSMLGGGPLVVPRRTIKGASG
jgi:hypothetical protein